MTDFKTIIQKEIVFIIERETIDDNLACKIISKIPPKSRIGLDMGKVQNINSPILIEYMLNNKIKLFNLQSEVLAYFALILKDGFLKSYINRSDFKNDKRELVKRHFWLFSPSKKPLTVKNHLS